MLREDVIIIDELGSKNVLVELDDRGMILSIQASDKTPTKVLTP